MMIRGLLIAAVLALNCRVSTQRRCRLLPRAAAGREGRNKIAACGKRHHRSQLLTADLRRREI